MTEYPADRGNHHLTGVATPVTCRDPRPAGETSNRSVDRVARVLAQYAEQPGQVRQLASRKAGPFEDLAVEPVGGLLDHGPAGIGDRGQHHPAVVVLAL